MDYTDSSTIENFQLKRLTLVSKCCSEYSPDEIEFEKTWVVEVYSHLTGPTVNTETTSKSSLHEWVIKELICEELRPKLKRLSLVIKHRGEKLPYENEPETWMEHHSPDLARLIAGAQIMLTEKTASRGSPCERGLRDLVDKDLQPDMRQVSVKRAEKERYLDTSRHCKPTKTVGEHSARPTA